VDSGAVATPRRGGDARPPATRELIARTTDVETAVMLVPAVANGASWPGFFWGGGVLVFVGFLDPTMPPPTMGSAAPYFKRQCRESGGRTRGRAEKGRPAGQGRGAWIAPDQGDAVKDYDARSTGLAAAWRSDEAHKQPLIHGGSTSSRRRSRKKKKKKKKKKNKNGPQGAQMRPRHHTRPATDELISATTLTQRSCRDSACLPRTCVPGLVHRPHPASSRHA